MANRICEVTVERGTGRVDAVIKEEGREIARISWPLGNIVAQDPELALDMIRSRFREWARVYHTTDVRIRTV